MGSKWRDTTLGEVVRLQRGHDLPEPQRNPGEVPVMGSFGITGWHNTAVEQGPGVTVGRSGASIGVVSYVDRPYWPLNTCLYVTDFLGNDPRFCYYWLREQNLAAFNSGSAQPSLNRNYVYLKRVHVPSSIEEQRSIALALSALDDKIELNRKMNETLEAMARALFKSWFVDFDPVRAKAEGLPTGLPDSIAALFSDCFNGVEDLPVGWSVCGLDGIARFLNGLALQKYPPEDGRVLPVIKIAQLRTEDTSGADQASANLPKDYIVEDGDVLFSWSGSLACILWAGGKGALNQHLFKVTSEKYPKWLYWLWILHYLEEFRAIAADKATTMGHIQRHHLSEARVVLPPEPLLREMDKHFKPLVDQIVLLKMESKSLSAIRDALLPRLISGEIRLHGESEA